MQLASKISERVETFVLFNLMFSNSSTPVYKSDFFLQKIQKRPQEILENDD